VAEKKTRRKSGGRSMNLSLQDPFAVAKEFPETLTTTLSAGGHSVVIQFNRRGNYLASGLADGSIVIYDLATNATIAHLQRDAHVRPVTSLCWLGCGRYLLSTSQDWTCKLWDLARVNSSDGGGGGAASAVIRQVRFDGPIWMATMHPSLPFVFVLLLFENHPVHVDARDAVKVTPLATEPAASARPAAAAAAAPEPTKRDKHVTLVTVFTPDGQWIFSGTSKGWLNVVLAASLETVHSVKLANANIKNLVILPNGRKLAVNALDRVIRQLTLPDFANEAPDQWDFEVEHRYQDVVNRLQWNLVTFNYNADFLVALTFGQLSQDLYVWETAMGSLVKILEGSNEELIDVKWNYARCMIGSTGLDSGFVYLWLIRFPQKWSALAPDFVEIEENIEYDEKEDEFDIIDDQVLVQRLEQEEDLEVDITTPETVDARGFELEASFVIPVDYGGGGGAPPPRH
jgi:COMPASS component SWD1